MQAEMGCASEVEPDGRWCRRSWGAQAGWNLKLECASEVNSGNWSGQARWILEVGVRKRDEPWNWGCV